MKYYKIGETYGKLEIGQEISTSLNIEWITKEEYETATGEVVIENCVKSSIIALIRERYSIDDELAIQRQRDINVIEWQEYFDFVEACKVKVKEG
jgi:hypothetical protein